MPLRSLGPLVGALAVSLGLPACGDGADGPGAGDPDCQLVVASDVGGASVPDDVAAVRARRCHGCHGEPLMRYAPMRLVTWEDFHVCRSESQPVPVHVRMRLRINDEGAPMPPIMEPQLTAEELAVLNAWADAGAPVGP